MNPIITIEGRLGADPELRFLPNGTAVCSFNLVSNDRVEEPRGSGTWVDKNPTWYRCSAFKTLGENVSESLRKGDLVLVVGKLSQRSYEKDGETKTSHQEIAVNAIGPSLQFTTVTVARSQRGGGGSGGARGGTGTPTADPWGTPPAQGDAFSQDPPF